MAATDVWTWQLSRADERFAYQISAYIRRWKVVSTKAMAIEVGVSSVRALELIQYLENERPNYFGMKGFDGALIDVNVYVLFDPF